MHVHVVGNACVDTTFRLGRFPAAGETLNASTYGDGLGGKGANQAVAAARTGASVTLWTALGKDSAGAWIRSRLDMELSDVQVNEFDLPSDRSTIVIDASGENFIVSGIGVLRGIRSDCANHPRAPDRGRRHSCHARKPAGRRDKCLPAGSTGTWRANRSERQPYRCRRLRRTWL